MQAKRNIMPEEVRNAKLLLSKGLSDAEVASIIGRSVSAVVNIDEILGAGSSARLGLDENNMAPIYDVIEELGNAFAAEKQRYAAKPAQLMNREQRRAQAKKGKHNPPVSYPAPPASRMVERVDAQVSAKQKTERLIDARQAMNALRDDPDAMQQLAAYALQIAAERHV